MDSIVSLYETPSNLYCPVTYIYKHVEPDAPEKVRYVGKSNDPDERLRQHIAHATNQSKNTHHGKWIASLLKRGLKPHMEIIEVVDFSIWQERELYWIEWHIEQGHDLTNTYFGGKGVGMIPLETRLQMSADRKGRTLSPEHVKRAADGRRGKKNSLEANVRMKIAFADRPGHPSTPETNAKISAANTGKKRGPLPEYRKQEVGDFFRDRKQSPEHIANRANARRGKKVSPEGCANMSAAQKNRPRRKHTPETIAKMSESKRRRDAAKKSPPDAPTLWD
jgi:hypothetical protein